MNIRITETEGGDSYSLKTFLVEGSLDFSAAQLLVSVCEQAALQSGQVNIDLSGVVWLDEAGAAVLRSLARQPQFTLNGESLFTRALLEEDEAAGD
ncbi:MAG: hypothetical protein U0Z53_25890 [Blastocatellia bacterium]